MVSRNVPKLALRIADKGALRPHDPVYAAASQALRFEGAAQLV